jgi:curved DNA-binding protein CbpA
MVLQVAPDADVVVIAAAYRALARRYHPDIAGPAGTEAMRRINAAWEILKDPVRRRDHDRSRSAPGPATPPGDTTAHAWFSRGPARDGTGSAGPPPGRPFGSVLTFGRHIGWSLGEVVRVDPGYLAWLEERPEGRPLRAEIDALLRRVGWRVGAADASPRRQSWQGR